MKGVYTQVEVKGANLDSFINILSRRGIYLKKIKKIHRNFISFSVKYNQLEKFFAISNELCYNIKVVKNWGVSYPVWYLITNIGLIIGAILFMVTAFISNDLILDIKYTGSGSVLSKQIESYLNTNGITQYSKFSDVDLKKLNSSVLSSNPNLSYVSCTKKGNVLYVESSLADNKIGVLSGKAQELVSSVEGVVEQIKVYRGTALVEVGQTVEVGTMLVSGEVEIKEQIVNVNVLAVATVIYQKTREYYSQYDNKESEAVAFYEEAFGDDSEIVESFAIKTHTEKGYKYTVTVKFRKTLFAG